MKEPGAWVWEETLPGLDGEEDAATVNQEMPSRWHTLTDEQHHKIVSRTSLQEVDGQLKSEEPRVGKDGRRLQSMPL